MPKPITVELTQIYGDLSYVKEKVNKIYDRMNEYDQGFVKVINNATVNERRMEKELQKLEKRVIILYGVMGLFIVIVGIGIWMGLV